MRHQSRSLSKPPRRGRLGTVGRNVLGWLAMTLFGALSTHAAEPPRAQSAALTSYQRDLVSILVLRDDATHLLGAALLARTLDQQPPGLDSASLLARADKAPDHGLLPTWIELSQCEAPADCPNPTALAALQAADPDNAAVWLLGLGRAARQHDAAGEQAMLAKAAAASRYDDYAGATLKTLVAAATALPVPKDVLAAYAGKTAAGPASAQAFLAFGSVGLHPRPGLLPLAALCAPDHDAAATLRADCLQLSTRLIWGSSPQARAAGLHLRETLSEDAATRRDAAAAQRDLVWQYRQYNALLLRAMTEQPLAVQLLRLAQHGGSENSLMSALLHAHGIPLEAPANAASAPAPAGSTAIPDRAVPTASASSDGFPAAPSITVPAVPASVAAPAAPVHGD